jgi:predicted MPP superfamily phosphohydrolase
MYVRDNEAVKVRHIDVDDHRLPVNFEGYKIVQISDLHNKSFGKSNSRLIRKIKKERPDVIVITGDLLFNYQSPYEELIHLCSMLCMIAPVYFVTGNHESSLLDYDFYHLMDGMKRAGVHILRNSKTTIERYGEKIMLMGLDDPQFYTKDNKESRMLIDANLSHLVSKDDPFTILLSHRPEMFDLYVKYDLPLVLTGHTHGGQIRVPFVGAIIAPNQGFFPSYDHGIYKCKSTFMYVTSGLGASNIHLRIFNPPELAVFTLHHR